MSTSKYTLSQAIAFQLLGAESVFKMKGKEYRYIGHVMDYYLEEVTFVTSGKKAMETVGYPIVIADRIKNGELAGKRMLDTKKMGEEIITILG